MRLTTLRVLAIATAFLVAAAATCLATFAQVPPNAPAALVPACSASALDLHDRGTTFAGSTATATFEVSDDGAACLLERVPHLTAFDGSDRAVALVQRKRIGVMRFVLRPLVLEHGGRATFSVVTSLQGSTCADIRNLTLAVGDGSRSTATHQTACERDDGSNVSISFFAPATGATPAPLPPPAIPVS
jgi:hypothetical protein